MNSPTDPASLPLSVQLIGFGLSIVLAGFKVFDFFRKPTLNVEITRDIYFRLIDDGEALFCSPVLLASNGPILVRAIKPLLKRFGPHPALEAEKKFPLSVMFVGEKVHGNQLLADHKFFGSTPLQYLEPSKPYRAVYVCFQTEYQERQKRAVVEYSNSLVQFRSEKAALIDENKDDVLADFNKLVEDHFHAMADLIQLEAGSYELTLDISYECVGWRFWGSKRSTSARLRFKVAEVDLKAWKLEFKQLLLLRGRQILTETSANFSYPQLTPYEIVEGT